MNNFTELHTGQSAEWACVLSQTVQHDFYHLASYHAVAEKQGEGEARLYVYHEGEYVIALPLLLRSLDQTPDLALAGAGWKDATSVYGYSGPVASHIETPPSVVRNFHLALTKALREYKVVAVFSRLHPLLPQRNLLSGVGEIATNGQTVSIDLKLPVGIQLSQYRAGHTSNIHRLRRLKFHCVHDREGSYLDQFIELYQETMARVCASRSYLFTRSYFQDLFDALRPNVHLFVAMVGNVATAAGLFVACGDLMQYHLAGTANEFLRLSPMKLVLDTARQWAYEQQMRVFHLGGGIAGQEDTLFNFKAGFSHRRHEFLTWRWQVVPDMYSRLSAAKARWNVQHGEPFPCTAYFPTYRYQK